MNHAHMVDLLLDFGRPVTPRPKAASLTVRDVSWGPRPGHLIVQPLSFHVAPGDMLAIVGPNGAGKSSLLRCLHRYHRPSTGLVRVDGDDLWSLKPREAARRIATVLQEQPSDFGLTVAEIVELGLTPHLRGWGSAPDGTARVDEALAAMTLAPLAARDFGSLSGGEKQRVLIARALAQRPRLLVLDEPTNHLDIRHQLEVLALLRRLNLTVIVSLHDLALAAAYADQVLVLRAGRMVAHGTPREVLTHDTIRDTFAVGSVIDTDPVTRRPRFSFHLDATATE